MFTNWAGDEDLIFICIQMFKSIYIYVLIPRFKVRKAPSSISIKDSSPGICSMNVFHQLLQNAKSFQARKQEHRN